MGAASSPVLERRPLDTPGIAGQVRRMILSLRQILGESRFSTNKPLIVPGRAAGVPSASSSFWVSAASMAFSCLG